MYNVIGVTLSPPTGLNYRGPGFPLQSPFSLLVHTSNFAPTPAPLPFLLPPTQPAGFQSGYHTCLGDQKNIYR